MSAKELRERLGEVHLVDVRMRSEWDAGHIPTAVHFEGGRIAWEELPFPLDKSLAIQCASGNRSNDSDLGAEAARVSQCDPGGVAGSTGGGCINLKLCVTIRVE
ncbi:MAG: rhodanese-like domain-containing protein [Candidatus Moduliflexus flocculans]|nr:rhodanese-like domain-containing protein [Candidatus Moduliflexus flocculans]